MRILLLFSDGVGDIRSFSRRLHLDFLLKLGDFYDLKLYGPNVCEFNNRECAPLEYNEKLAMKDVVRIIKPQVIVCFSHVLTNKWLPSDFKHVNNVPKVIIEGDYHDVKNKGWYVGEKFDLVIHRGSEFYESVESVWMPLAASSEFYTDVNDIDHKKRKSRILYLGMHLIYPYKDIRRNAIKELEEVNLLKGKLSDKKLENLSEYLFNTGIVSEALWNKRKEHYRYIVRAREYPGMLKKYVGSLSCAGGSLRQTVGKIYEIMASGTVLLTQRFNRHYDLFGDDVCVFYKDDCSDIAKKARIIINDKDYSEYIAKNAVSEINEKHMDYHRIEELCNILEALHYGKEIPRKWGI